MKNFRIDELKIIKAIAQTSSVSKAARYLDMPQSNVSRTLSNVERRIGLEIFTRTPSALQSTAFGREFLTAVNELLAKHHELLDIANTYKRKIQGVVTLGAPIGFHGFLGKYLFPALQKIYPDLVINLITCNPETLHHKYGAVFNSDCDILISIFKPQNENLVARPFIRFRTGAFASPGYLAKHPLLSPQDLPDHACITLSMLGGRENVWRFIDEHGQMLPVTVTGRCICDSTIPAVELAKQGMGIIYAPYYSLLEEVAGNALIPCFSEDHCIDMTASLIYQQRDMLPLRVQALLDGMLTSIQHFDALRV